MRTGKFRLDAENHSPQEKRSNLGLTEIELIENLSLVEDFMKGIKKALHGLSPYPSEFGFGMGGMYEN